MLSACPTAIVAAPVELVWANLVDFERFCDWADVVVVRSEPVGPAVVGQTITFRGKGPAGFLRFHFKMEEVNAERHQLGALAVFPLGLQERVHISCTPIDATSCRVSYG